MRGLRWTVYCHIHVESGRRYVGLTKLTMMKRWNQHVANAARKQGKGCRHLWNAIRKYGKDAFSHEVLEVCLNLEVANLAEECWIELFETRDPTKGFNLIRGGTHTPHPVKNPWNRPGFREKHPSTIAACHTPAARASQKASLTKEVRSAATRRAQARPDVRARQAELHADPAYLAKISESTKAALARPDVQERLKAGLEKSAADPHVRAKKAAGIRAAFQDPEVKERHRVAVVEAQNRPEAMERRRSYRASDETKEKIRAASTGKLHTPESVELQRRLYLARSSSCKFCLSPIEGKRSAVRGRVACARCYDLHRTSRASFLRPDGRFL